MKNNIVRLSLVALLVVTVVCAMFAFVGCGGADTKNLQKPENIYALAGVSTGALLEGMANVGGGVAMADEIDEGIIDELNEYMTLVNSLISCRPSDSVVKASDRADYPHMQVMNVPDMEGKWTEYKLYYKEADTANVALDDGEEDEEEEPNADEEESEYESHITGIMVIGEKEFPIKGDISVETEADESEQSIEFVAYIDDTNYIKMEQSAETEQEDGKSENSVSYTYEIFENGVSQGEFELEVETEGDETEYSIETESADGSEVEFELTKETKGDKTLVKVTYDKNGTKGTFDVEATVDENGKPVYRYTMRDKTIDKDRD